MGLNFDLVRHQEEFPTAVCAIGEDKGRRTRDLCDVCAVWVEVCVCVAGEEVIV